MKKKLKKKTIYTLRFDEFIMKINIERFGCNNLPQDFKFVINILKIAMGVISSNIHHNFSRIESPEESYYNRNIQRRFS